MNGNNEKPRFLQPSAPDDVPIAILLRDSPCGSGAHDQMIGGPLRAGHPKRVVPHGTDQLCQSALTQGPNGSDAERIQALRPQAPDNGSISES
jgi:hypothetical protein